MVTFEVEKYLEENASVIAYKDGKEIGWASVLLGGEAPSYVERIDIDESERGKGIGTEMLEYIASEFGGVTIAADNARANRLYERLGSEYTGDDAPYIDQGYGVWYIA